MVRARRGFGADFNFQYGGLYVFGGQLQLPVFVNAL